MAGKVKDVTIKINLDTGEIIEGRKEFDKLNKQVKKTGKEAEKSVGGMNKSLVKMGGVLASVFAVSKLIDFGKQIIQTTSEFEKLEAVLTNTLGTNSAAQKSLAMIQKFAAKTPFSVIGLTNAFVKLTNQGFKPTQKEMTKLGDLASSTGKTFDQLAEAIIDAQVGEFERLKEFGIRARKEGDNVSFTFKGVTKEVQNTEESIRSYLLSLGDLQGVSGAMASISKTMGGQISNLGDTYDAFLLSLGNSESVLGQVASKLIGMASNTLSLLTATEKQTDAQIEQNRVESEYNNLLADEQANLNTTFEALKDKNTSSKVKKTLTEQINTVYGDYLPNLLDEESSLKEIEAAQRLVNGKLKESIGLKLLDMEIAKNDAKFKEREIELIDRIASKTGKSRAEVIKFAEKNKVVIDGNIEGNIKLAESFGGINTDIDNLTSGMDEYSKSALLTSGDLSELMTITQQNAVANYDLEAVVKSLSVAEEKAASQGRDNSKDYLKNLRERSKAKMEEHKRTIKDNDEVAKMDDDEQQRLADNNWKEFDEVHAKNEAKKKSDEDYANKSFEIDQELKRKKSAANTQSFEEYQQSEQDKLDLQRSVANQSLMVAAALIGAVKQMNAEADAIELEKLAEEEEEALEKLEMKQEAERDELERQYEEGIISKEKLTDGLEAIDNKYNSEKEKAQDGFDKREADAKKKAFNDQKKLSLLQAAILTAQSILQASAAAPPPANIPLIAGAAALGAIQIGLIAAQKTPAFKDGVIDLQGAGTGTSDSIHARLSKGESVMTARETLEHKPLLKAIRNNKFDEHLDRIILQKLYSGSQSRKEVAISSSSKEVSFPDRMSISNARAISKPIVDAMEEQNFLNQNGKWD